MTENVVLCEEKCSLEGTWAKFGDESCKRLSFLYFNVTEIRRWHGSHQGRKFSFVVLLLCTFPQFFSVLSSSTSTSTSEMKSNSYPS